MLIFSLTCLNRSLKIILITVPFYLAFIILTLVFKQYVLIISYISEFSLTLTSFFTKNQRWKKKSLISIKIKSALASWKKKNNRCNLLYSWRKILLVTFQNFLKLSLFVSPNEKLLISNSSNWRNFFGKLTPFLKVSKQTKFLDFLKNWKVYTILTKAGYKP